jgi:cell division protein YceG involved in septum cleavage
MLVYLYLIKCKELMVDIFISLVVLVVVVCSAGMVRGFIAQDRIQKCIDNGKAGYDGTTVVAANGLSKEEATKIELERDILVKAGRAFTGLFKIYRKNSLYR